MARKVRWSKRAAIDFAQIIDYWDNHNKSIEYSNRLKQLVEQDINLLLNFPTIGNRTDFLDVYQHVVENFKIYYKFDSSLLLIVRVWDSRRNPNDLAI
jgi:toxin YoeB